MFIFFFFSFQNRINRTKIIVTVTFDVGTVLLVYFFSSIEIHNSTCSEILHGRLLPGLNKTRLNLAPIIPKINDYTFGF